VGDISQLFLDAQQLVVFSHAIGTRERASLDLHGVGCHSNVGNGGVFRFAGTVRNDSRVAGAFSHFNGSESFCQGADLVNLDENGVGDPLLNALLEDLGVRNEQVIADQLHLAPQLFGKQLPAFPVVLGHTVFNGDDGILVAPTCQQIGEI